MQIIASAFEQNKREALLVIKQKALDEIYTRLRRDDIPSLRLG